MLEEDERAKAWREIRFFIRLGAWRTF